MLKESKQGIQICSPFDRIKARFTGPITNLLCDALEKLQRPTKMARRTV